MVGAYLTQNTAWTNVERALASLRKAELLTVEGLRRVKLARLDALFDPLVTSGKRRRGLNPLSRFSTGQDCGSLEKLFSEPTEKLREELLNLNGVGPETADSILLYAGNHPVFVVDAYTRRILDRHEILPEKTDYEEIRQLFHRSLLPIAKEQEQNSAREAEPLASGISRRGPSSLRTSTARRTALV